MQTHTSASFPAGRQLICPAVRVRRRSRLKTTADGSARIAQAPAVNCVPGFRERFLSLICFFHFLRYCWRVRGHRARKYDRRTITTPIVAK